MNSNNGIISCRVMINLKYHSHSYCIEFWKSRAHSICFELKVQKTSYK